MVKNKPNNNAAVDNLTKCVINAIQDVKGQKITDINLESLESAPASRFVICQGKSTTQVSAIADNIREHTINELHIKPYNIDGYRNSQWIVLDFGTVMVHIFMPEYRLLYNLEDLWSDAEVTEIPDLD